MRVVAYRPDYNEKLAGVVEALAAGIPGCEVVPLGRYVPADIAIVFGAVKDSYSPTWPKREIMQRHAGRRLLMIESGFFRRGEYYQVGWGGYAGTADFNLARFGGDIPADRWDALGMKSQPWQRRPGGLWVVMGQVPWDTQVQDMDHKRWCCETVQRLDEQGRRVVFRPHPRIKAWKSYGVRGTFVDRRPMAEVLAEAEAVVTWNSTSAVDALIEGVPAVACDPSSVSWPVATQGLDVPLRYPSRRQWLNGLGWAMWTLDEMRAGLTWEHLTHE